MVKNKKGTTTLAFIFDKGVIVAADSRASMGGYICKYLAFFSDLCLGPTRVFRRVESVGKLDLCAEFGGFDSRLAMRCFWYVGLGKEVIFMRDLWYPLVQYGSFHILCDSLWWLMAIISNKHSWVFRTAAWVLIEDEHNMF